MQIQTETRVVEFMEFDGLRFYRDKRGYWLGHQKDRKNPVRMHVYVWEYYNGEIPKGYQVHHKDHNPDNNEIENLELLPKHEHLTMHAHDEQRLAWARNNLSENARPKATEWHKSEEGRKWHKQRALSDSNTPVREEVTKTCQFCGKEYKVIKLIANQSRFCSESCKAKWRWQSGVDNEIRICPNCGKEFATNKYNNKRYCCINCRTEYHRKMRSQSHQQE